VNSNNNLRQTSDIKCRPTKNDFLTDFRKTLSFLKKVALTNHNIHKMWSLYL